MSPRILICDDDELSLELVASALRDRGYEAVCVTSGDAGRRRLDQDDSIRIVVADWEMPGMTGPELCTWLRTHRASAYTYAILLSARTDEGSVLEGFAAGADDFIRKPVNPDELYLRIRAGERLLSVETRESMIFALAKLAESRDPETGAHLERTRQYCKVLAEDLMRNRTVGYEVDAEFVRLMWLTSPLHDIGKVGIPDCVLLKPARLDDREFAIMKSHTTIGAETIQCAIEHAASVPRFLKLAHEIALCHHERWDGGGYPRGLKGEEIPIAARVMAVSDVYDALTSKRVYKNAMTHEVARGILLQGAGTHFDQRIIDAFLRVEPQFDYIKMAWNEEGHADSMRLAA